MKLRLHDKNRAIDLRKSGYTYSEIQQIIPNLSKGTLSGWLKNIPLSTHDKERILAKMLASSETSRIRGAWTNKQKAIERIQKIQKKAEEEFQILSKKPLFISGLCLYWAEGAKKSRSFQFINSDPEMIKLIIVWLKKILKTQESDIKIRLYIHKVYKNENCEKYWLNITELPNQNLLRTVYKPTIHLIKKNPLYKGCCRIELKNGSEVFWKIMKWQEMLKNKFLPL